MSSVSTIDTALPDATDISSPIKRVSGMDFVIGGFNISITNRLSIIERLTRIEIVSDMSIVSLTGQIMSLQWHQIPLTNQIIV